jgi:hypothetical protein
MYHFFSGYAARVAGTERGVREPKVIFRLGGASAPGTVLTTTRRVILESITRGDNMHERSNTISLGRRDGSMWHP